MTSHRHRRLLAALALAVATAACGGDADVATVDDEPADAATSEPAGAAGATDGDAADEDVAGDTSTPADEDLVQAEPTSVTRGEAEAIADAYIGLTQEQAEEQAVIDDRTLRVGSLDGESMMLTEDFQVGRITLMVSDGVVYGATVEATDGEVSVVED